MTTRALMHSTQIAAVLTLEFICISDAGPRLSILPLMNLTPILFYALALAGWFNRQWFNVCEVAAAIISLWQALGMAIGVIVSKPFYSINSLFNMPVVGIG